MFDCIIIGGGLAGLMSAREISLRGLKVAVFERGRLGAECSWAGGGILAPLYPWREVEALNQLAAVSQRLYPLLAADLAATTGIDPEWVQCGMLSHSVTDMAAAEAWARKTAIPFEIRSRESAGLTGRVLWFPSVAQVRNPRLISALKASLTRLGVSIYEHTRIQRIKIRQGQVCGLVTEQDDDYNATAVVIANGAWAAELLPEIPVRPVRGQMLCYQGPPDHLDHIILNNGIYLIPRKDGHILAGSTVEETGFDKSTTEAARMLLSNAAEEMLPGINRFPLVGHWSGLRPAPHSNYPYIGACHDIKGLYLNTGHHRNGILLAPAAATLLADIMLGQPSVVPASPYQCPAIHAAAL